MSAPGFLTSDPWYYETDSDWRFAVPDKFQHFWGSAFLSYMTDPTIAFLCGVGKEIYDLKVAKVGFSYRDLIADFLGIVSERSMSRSSKLKAWLDYKKDDNIIFKVGYSF